MKIQQYIDSVNQRFKQGNATEHTFRGDLQQLLETLLPDIRATNEPKRRECGAPDYILTRKEIPVGFIEAKDIGDADLDGTKKTGNKEQFDRYKASLNNLIFTDYLRFHFYRDGEKMAEIKIAEVRQKPLRGGSELFENEIVSLPENFAAFKNLLLDFGVHVTQNIKSSKELARMMAGKARLLADVIEKSLLSDSAAEQDSTLKDQMSAFREILIHDITPKGFADVYAQTIAYGLFAARLHDPDLDTFSRQEAAELIPKSNPFLRKLFGYIAGPDIDDRIKWIVDDLIEIFLACNVEQILQNYGRSTKMEDPIIHFYEDFLSQYDPKLRKARGVWYTPQPVVNFIVRAVDDILKTEFGLSAGLADTSKTKINTEVQGKKVEKEVHKVQILDPATGTGTFLAEVIKHVHRKFEGQQGIWSNYVESHLLPRLNGFELLMASYAMAHLKLDLLLKETGYASTGSVQANNRFRVYLTNSLEEASQERPNLFMSQWLTEEGQQADAVKRDTPVMCVIGNPPYSISSSNKGEWIENLTCDYKKELNEKNIQALSDDYIKFIRFGQYYVEKNGYGILAYISNNSFVDGVIHRKMRENLLKSFDEIYIIDLHGSTKKREKAADGGIDENVFDIMQGVSINIFVKNEKKQKNAIANIYHFDLFGKRQFKYDFLSSNNLKSIVWKKINPFSPFFFFTNKELNINNSSNAFEIASLFRFFNSGLTTEFDEVAIQENKAVSETLLNNLLTKSTEDIANIYNLNYSKYSKKISNAIKDLSSNKSLISEIYYRPFESKYTIYTGKSNGIMGRPRNELMKHFISKNIGLVIGRQGQAVGGEDWNIVTITKTFTDSNIFRRGRGTVFPLYLYPESNAQQSLEPTAERTPNLNLEIVKQIEEKLGLAFVPEEPHTPKPSQGGNFAPIDLLDYIYAVLHSPTYREKYKEFLKIDFPRVPYPKDAATFWQLVKLGGEIRQIHLLESPTVEKYITQYPVSGDNVVGKIRFERTPDPSQEGKRGRVYINDTQYFANVPETAWNFYIGGYQPAQKWLKDRKERVLDFEDISHYQKIIVALSETDRLMKEIDTIEIE